MYLEPLETPRLVIRRFRPDDWKAVYEYMSDREVVAYLPEGRMTEAQTREFLAKHTGDNPEALAVTLKADGALVGHVAFHPWFAPRTYEIGWAFNRRYHGQGYATEACRAGLDHIFGPLGADRVVTGTAEANEPSCRLLRKLDLKVIDRSMGSLQETEEGEPIEVVTLSFSITREEWAALNN